MRHFSDCRECGRALATEPGQWLCADCAARRTPGSPGRGHPLAPDLDNSAEPALECGPLRDVLLRVPGVNQVEDGWRLAVGSWRVGFDVKANHRGWAAIQFIAWAVAEDNGATGAALTVEAAHPPRRGRARGEEPLTFCLVGRGDPSALAAALADRLADMSLEASAAS